MLNIQHTLEKYYNQDDTIILACSAWPDSMFLLYQILETSFSKNLVVCYFNHQTRKETDEEEVFLRKLSEQKGFIFEVATCDFDTIQKLYPSKSFEELAREKRYQFLDTILHIYQSHTMILWHHLDDKIETFFFNLSRWTKLSGLINMTEFSGHILRPLIWIHKTEILDYLNTNNLAYKIDESNNDTKKYSRNHLRHNIIPQFEQLNSNYKKNISNCIDYFDEIHNFINNEVEKFLSKNQKYFSIEDFNSQSFFLQKEIIRYIYYIENWKSTIWLKSSNIDEIIRFINGKNNKTHKHIHKLKMRKENTVIYYKEL